MKKHWHINPLPPPDESTDGGFVSFALLLFVIIGPLIYFGPELRTIETWLVDIYRTVVGSYRSGTGSSPSLNKVRLGT